MLNPESERFSKFNFYYLMVHVHELSELVQFPIHCLSLYHPLERQGILGHYQM